MVNDESQEQRQQPIVPGMNNRIPPVIAQFAKTPNFEGFSFLTFQDWFAKRELGSSDWIIVARQWHEDVNGWYTDSVLAKTKNKEALNDLLSTSTWEVTSHFMTYYSGLSIKRHSQYVKGYNAYNRKVTGVEFVPFSIFRNLHAYKPKTFEPLQDFVLSYNAFFIPESEEYQRFDDEGELHTIARIKRVRNNLTLEVDADHLRRYLAENDCYLIRYHDHHRYSEDDVSKDVPEPPLNSFKFSSTNAIYEIWIGDTILPHKEKNYKSVSRLLGKDIIYPYMKNNSVEDVQEKFASFIIGRNESGETIESTCSEEELSNYFRDTGKPHFLTPVFFKPEVLSRYLGEPSRFLVTDNLVGCLDFWSIDIDRTDENLIQVWLGDLGSLPYNEQLYWRRFNVQPKGTITKHRFARDFEAKFADPVNDRVFDFYNSLEKIQGESHAKYGKTLFLELHEKDKHALSSLHLPLTEEQIEFDQQVQSLAKVINDSLNTELLVQQTGKKIDPTTEIRGSLSLLSEFLGKIGFSESERKNLMKAFYAIQALRSTGAAHRKGIEFENALRKYNLTNLTNRDRFSRMLNDLTASLNAISLRIS